MTSTIGFMTSKYGFYDVNILVLKHQHIGFMTSTY